MQKKTSRNIKGKCPCIKCICLPSCRNKNYPTLINTCETLYDYIILNSCRGKGIVFKVIYYVLKPKWKIGQHGSETDFENHYFVDTMVRKF